MRPPLMIDLFCGSFGWSAGWLELGGRVVGFDLDHQPYHGPIPKGADLVLQDVRTIHGAQFKDVALIVASSPCQEFSWRAMPWKAAKAAPPPHLGMELFAQAARIQREAIAAAGHFIPMVQENVRGAQPWVGRARWHYGSYYLWGDVPALMPITFRMFNKIESPHLWLRDPKRAGGKYAPNYTKTDMSVGCDEHDDCYQGPCKHREFKNSGGSWFNVAHNTTSGKGQNPDGRPLGDETKIGGERFREAREHPLRKHSSKSNARKAASARIAKIPPALARWIAHVYFPKG